MPRATSRSTSKQAESSVRSTPGVDSIMREIQKASAPDSTSSIRLKANASLQTSVSSAVEYSEDVSELLALGALTSDANPGQVNTSGSAGLALTSTMSAYSTSGAMRLATVEELREARWKKLRQVGCDVTCCVFTVTCAGCVL